MSTQGVIKTLFSDKEKTEALFPRTKLSAVSAEDGTGLNAIIDDLNTQLDTKATESFVTNKIAEAQLNSGGDVDLSGYATKDDLNSRVPTSRTVNGKALSSNVTLSASDVRARASTWMPTAAQVGSIQQSANYYSSGKSADDLGATDSLALIPCNTTTNAELYAIISSTYAYVLTLYYNTIAQRAQIAISYATNPPKMAIRTLYGGTWTPWTQIGGSAGMIREFNSGVINVAPQTIWTYNGDLSKIYVATVKVDSFYYSFIVDWQTVNGCSNKTMVSRASAMSTEFALNVKIDGNSIQFWTFGCNLIQICGYY